jgi:predicted DNA-binding transcriptional regulator YafY
MATNRLARILRLVTALQSGRSYSVEELCQITGVSRRTVFRDLRLVQKAGIPCQYLGSRRRYAIDPSFFLPPPNLSSEEALGLLLLAHKMRGHLQLPLTQPAVYAALKVENGLSEDLKDFCSRALSAITVKPAHQWDEPSFDKLFLQLLEAVLGNKVVSLHCVSLDERDLDTIEFCPYHLVYNEHGWHVIGRAESFAVVTSFRLAQIKALRVTDRLFVKDERFDIDEYLGRAWSMKREGRLRQVRLRFLPEVAESVAKIQWHSTQTTEFLDDGSVVLRFHVDGLAEIVWWILSYGDKVRVLAPTALRDKVIEIARKTISANQQTSHL